MTDETDMTDFRQNLYIFFLSTLFIYTYEEIYVLSVLYVIRAGQRAFLDKTDKTDIESMQVRALQSCLVGLRRFVRNVLVENRPISAIIRV